MSTSRTALEPGASPTWAYSSRRALSYVASRGVVVGSALTLGMVWWSLGPVSKIVVLALVLGAVIAGLAAAGELGKRAGWYRDPGTPAGRGLKLGSALGDATLVLVVAIVLTSDGAQHAIFPGAAIAKASALVVVSLGLWELVRDVHRFTPAPLASLAVRFTAASAAWILADRVVPDAWRGQQALEVAGAAVLVGAGLLAVRRATHSRQMGSWSTSS